MCRCTDPDSSAPFRLAGVRRFLKIRAFHLRLTLSACSPLPDSLTLVYLPSPLEMNGSKPHPNSPAVAPLHRFRPAERSPGEIVFASTDRVHVAEGQRFEAYAGELVAVSGSFRRGRDVGEWKVEVRCGELGEFGVCKVGVRVVGERGEVMVREVELPRRARKARGRGFCARLEGIPEEGEECECRCCCEGDWEVVEGCGEEEVGVEGVRWAVDVGIWVVCLGMGLLVSKASTSYQFGRKRGKRRMFLFG